MPGPGEATQRPGIWQTPLGRIRGTQGSLLLRGLLLALFGVVVLRTAWMCDDAYITLRTVDNFVHGYGLRWNVAEKVQTFTHPLWLLAGTVAYLLTREAFYTILVLSMAISLAAVGLMVFRSRATGRAAALAALMLLASRAFMDYSTSGLENPLTHLLIVVFLIRLRDEAPSGRRLLILSVSAGLATLNRMDTFLLFAPALIYALLEERGRFGWARGLRIAASGFLPFILWEAFAVLYYGFPLPNTALAKLGTGIDSFTMIRHGFYYLWNSVRVDPVTLTVIGSALIASAVRRRKRELAVAAGIALYLLYAVKIGGDFMSGRFLSAPFLTAVVLLMQMDTVVVRWGRPVLAVLVVALGFATPYPSILSGRTFGAAPENLMDRHGICDERRYYFGMTGMLNDSSTGEKPSHAATQTGRTARQAMTPLIAEGAVGVTGFFAGPAVHIVDYHALGDALLSRMPMVEHDDLYDKALRGLIGTTDPQGWRVGHYLRNIPHGHFKTLLTGRNQLEDPNLARFYEKLSFVIRGPIWSRPRIVEIVKMNTGRYDTLIDRARPARSEPVPWEEIAEIRPDVAEAHYRLGLVLSADGKDDDATSEFSEAIRLNPRHVDALNALGWTYSGGGNVDQAVVFWTRALNADSGDPKAYVYLAEVAQQEGRSARAIDLLKQAVRLDPRLGIACNNLGVAYRGLGNSREAIRWLERARALKPESPEILEDLGVVYADVGDGKKALRMLEKAVSLAPERPELLAEAAAANERAGNVTRAVALLRRASVLSPPDPEICFELGRMLDSGGDPEGAIESWRRSARLGYEPARQCLNAKGLVW